MEKKKLVFGAIFVLVLIGLIFIVEAGPPPSGLIFEDNTTTNFDKEGIFTFNWTAVGDAVNYSIYISLDGGGSWPLAANNDSATGYSFSNQTDANYTFRVEATNATPISINSTYDISMVVDDTVPVLLYGTGTEDDVASSTVNFTFVNVTASDTNNDTLYFSLYNSTGLANKTSYSSYSTLTINWTSLSEGTYYYNVTANDSATNSNTTSTYTFIYDVTNPVATLSCSPSSITLNGIVTCTCSGADSGSGINSTLTSAATTPSTASTGTFTVTGCSVTDYAGNLDTATDTYTVTSGGGSGSSEPPKKTHSWTKITPGAATIMKNFDEEIGIKQISIEVNNPAQNVKITVTKYDGKPANVSVEKSGKVYRYLHVEAKNLNEKLKKGIIGVQVEKSWIEDEKIALDLVAVSKFNENNNEWEELNTIYVEADDDYYYYDAEVTSFSYFAISGKVVVGEEEEEEEREDGAPKEGLEWWVISLIVLGGLIILYAIYANKKKISKFFKKR